MRRRISVAALGLAGTILVLAVVLTWRQPVRACGPFFSIPVFVSRYAPDPPFTDFTAGHLGHVRATWARRHLAVAYRYLSGTPLGDAEQQVAGRWRLDLDDGQGRSRNAGMKEWLSVRRTVMAEPQPDVTPYRSPAAGAFWSFLNCPDNAFTTAASTLTARSHAESITRADLVEWVRAQDQVFSNCTGGHEIPSSLAASSPLLARQDRAYQIAAAHFYATDFDEAEQAFRAIARDATSPWQHLPPYLAARCLIRKGTVKAGGNTFDRPLLEQAARELQAYIATAADPRDRTMAEQVLAFALFRTAPLERVRQVGVALAKRGLDERIGQALVDYTGLLDRAHGEDAWEGAPERLKRASGGFARLAEWRATSDLTDWIITFQAAGDDATAHAMARWRESHSPAWLVAVLDKTSPESADLSAVLQAAREVAPQSPAYPTAVYHIVRLEMARGNQAAMREMLDRLLASPPAWPPSTLNELRAARMSLARDIDEFIRFAPRVPAAEGSDYVAGVVPVPGTRPSPPGRPATAVSPRWQHAFDHDAATALNEHMPIAVLARVAASPVMPETLRDEIGRAAWTRAVLLGQDDATRDLFPFIERAVPSMTAELSAYRAATTPAARQRSALFLLLKLPGLHPNVAPGLGRDPAYGRPDHPLEPIAQMDPFRDNWWCEAGAFSGMSSYNDPGAPPSNAPAPAFLAEPERTRARTEVAAIRKLPTAAIVLCDRATAWARATPDDPRIPEALYLAIRASHYGCGGRTAASSAAAFRLLKSPRYANTEWAKKAKYYY